MQVVLYRIDERLIHGQVMTLWLGKTAADTVIIVDEVSAKDDFMKQIYRLAAPPNVSVDAVGVQDFREMLKSGKAGKAIILFKGPREAHAALCEDVEPGELIIGNVSAAAGRKKVTKFAYMSQEEKALMAELQAKGWSVNIQLLPTETKAAFKA